MKKIVILFGLLALGLVVVVLSFSGFLRINPLDFFSIVNKMPTLNILYIALLYFMIFAVVFSLLKRDGRDKFAFVGLSQKPRLQTLIFLGGTTVLVFASYVVALITFGTAAFEIKKEFVFLALQGVFFGFLYALVEEILFRGYILKTLMEQYSPEISIIIANSIFALLHLFCPGSFVFKIFNFTGLFLLGLVLSYCVIKTASLWSAILVHNILIFGMYILPFTISFNMDKYEPLAILWGINKTPIAGYAGFTMMIIFLLILIRCPISNDMKNL